jgi:hypothetical protein
MQSISPSMSTPTSGSGAHMNDMQSTSGGSNAYHGPLPPIMNQPQSHQSRGLPSNATYHSPSASSANPGGADFHPPQLPPSYANYPPVVQGYPVSNSQGPVLPPFSSIQTMGPPGSQQSSASSVRYNPGDNGQSQRQAPRHHVASSSTGSKRHAPGSSNVTSADSSELDDDENGELPASGLVAPWEVLRGLADVAIERAAKASVTGLSPRV